MFENKKTTLFFYLFILLFTLHITPAVYVNSNYLSLFFDAKYIGLIYSIASLSTVFVILRMRDKLKKIGNYQVFISTLFIEMVALVFLIFSINPIITLFAFIALFVCHSTAFVNLDIFLEQNTPNDATGKIRGWYLTAMNIAFIIGPFLSSLFLVNDRYSYVYIFILLLLFPIIYFAKKLFKDFKDTQYEKVHIWRAFKKIKMNEDVYATLVSDFILKFFYAWMVIYTPLYLSNYIGFTISEVALILSIALIPFLIIQSFAGKIADDTFGEKEMMSIGFIVMAFFTICISFINTQNISIWIAVLFMTRVGASMVELMTETHLFKRIDSKDLSIISLFRISRPIAYISGALLGTFFLQIISFQMLFFVLGGIVIYGLRYSLIITDTK
jgi:predicted MFS family arabinose efflux permease